MKNRLTIRDNNSLTIEQENKLALFKSKGIENLVHSHDLIPLGNGKYKLVPMKNKYTDIDISSSLCRGNYSYSKRMLGENMTSDETKLFILDGGINCSIEMKETVAAYNPCL